MLTRGSLLLKDNQEQTKYPKAKSKHVRHNTQIRLLWKSAVLCLAACNGNYKLTKIALLMGAAVDGIGDLTAPLYQASKRGHLDVVELLLNQGAQIDKPRHVEGCLYTPLYVSALRGHVSVVEVLLSRGAEIEGRTTRGHTPLSVACYNGRRSVVDVLLSRGAQINFEDSSDITPLHCACQEGFLDIVNLLLKKGARVNSLVKGGTLPLHLVCLRGHLDVAKLLLSWGAHINPEAGDRHLTPLQTACQKGHPGIVKLLLDNGASLGRKREPRYWISTESPLSIELTQQIASLILWSGVESPTRLEIPSEWPNELSFFLLNFPMMALGQLLHMVTTGGRSSVKVITVHQLRGNYPTRLILVLRAIVRNRVPWTVCVIILKKATRH